MQSSPHPELRELAPGGPDGLRRAVGLAMLFRALDIREQPVHVGRFEVRSTLGRGASGTVYQAFDPTLERDVALKVLDQTLAPELAEGIRTEARALARLNHPNVVGVYELGMEGSQSFVAMEFVSGETLAGLVSGPDAPRGAELLHLFLQAGLGVQAAHEAGLIHRDIKPENILVSSEGRVCVADFGLATREQDPTVDVAGTPVFMAPEVLRDGQTSTLSDQYSFCASFWRCLDAERPLGSPTHKIETSLQATLRRGLSAEPTERWPDMAQLLDALAAELGATPKARQRRLLLMRVKRQWIEGVLNPAMAEGPVFALSMSRRPDLTGGAANDVGSLPVEAATLRQELEAGAGSLLVLGEPGAGKTTALLLLARTLLREASVDPASPVPVVLLLSSLAQHAGPLELWVEQEVVAKYGLPRHAVQTWIRSGSLVLLLDGLDEVAQSRRAACAEMLSTFRREHGLPMVLTCRMADYQGSPTVGSAVCIDPVVSVETPTLQGEPLASGLSTPLMLRLLSTELPASERNLDALYESFLQHHVLPNDTQTLPTLTTLARAMTKSDRSGLWLEQLEPHWVFDDWRHPATLALGLSMLVSVSVSVNVAAGVLVDDDALSGLILGLCSVPMILVFNGGFRIRPVERLRFSGSRWLRLLPIGVGLGLAAGAIYGSLYVLWVNMVFGSVAGLVASLVIAFEPSLHETRVRTNQGMHQSLLNGLGLGLLGMLLGGVTLGYVTVPLLLPYLEPPSTLINAPHPERSAAVVAGVMLAVLVGMVRGGWAVMMHMALRITLAATSPVPLRLAPLLDAATSDPRLRRVGGGYIFPHRSFQEFLARRSPR